MPCRSSYVGLPLVLAAYATAVRPRLLRWGATKSEVARWYPGDELIPDADGGSTMATTLPSAPEAVWPWLVQMGHGRGGWYSWDLLDNFGRHSADRIAPEWQPVTVGQHLDSTPDGKTWFTVAHLVPNRDLVLRATLRWPFGGSFDPESDSKPRTWGDSIWGFHLEPAEGDQTRLVVRTRGRGHPRLLTRPIDVLFWEPAHLIMQIRQFQNLRARLARKPGFAPVG